MVRRTPPRRRHRSRAGKLTCAVGPPQVSASAAQRRRVNGDKKIASNVTKRGMVTDPASEVRTHAPACVWLPHTRRTEHYRLCAAAAV
eukprot:scaffold24329_cov101-Isochrysis_galbana.AAC.3